MNRLIRPIRALAMRCRGFLWPLDAERDLDAEIRSHLEMHIDDNVAKGMTREDARREALIELGGIEQSKELVRDRYTLPVLETTVQNVRYAFRVLRKTPGFTAVALLTLALGIGANTAVFSIVDAVLLRPLPFGHAAQLVLVGQAPDRETDAPGWAMPGEFTEWRQRNNVFKDLAAVRYWVENLSGTEQTTKVFGARVTANFFPMLEVKPRMGRIFLPAEDRPGHGRVVIISDALWKRVFDGQADIVGRTVQIDGQPRTVVGVMPPSFEFLPPALKTRMQIEMWAPMAGDASFWSRRDSRNLTVIGRLNPGVTPKVAQSAMNALFGQIGREHPGTIPGNNAVVTPLRIFLTGNTGAALIVLMGAVALVLLIACTNLANLLLARAISRRREMVVRIALGASRSRVVGQVLTESLLLSFAGACLGLLLAHWATKLPIELGPADVAGLKGASVNLAVLVFTLTVSLASGVLFGLAPAFSAFNGGATRSNTESRGTVRLRGFLLVSEIALAMVLTLGAGLLFRDFLRLSGADLGFKPKHLLTVQVSLPSGTYGNTERQSAFFRDVLARVTSLPGVEAAGAVNYLPLTGDLDLATFGIEGRPRPRANQWPIGQSSAVTPGYFRSMGIPLLRGRLFTEADDSSAPKVVIVNEALARKYFANEDPIGHNIKLGGLNPQKPWWTIVGVAGNEKFGSVDSTMQPEYYLPYHQEPYDDVGDMSLTVRTRSDPLTMAPSIRRAIRSIDKQAAVDHFTTMDQLVSKSMSTRRFNMTLLLLYAGLALSMAVAGVQGVVAYSVSQRVREIGIRLALGAMPRSVTRSVVQERLMLGLTGVVAGLCCTLALGRVSSSLLYELRPRDPIVLVTVSALLLVVTSLASYLPARRAGRVDPISALRED